MRRFLGRYAAVILIASLSGFVAWFAVFVVAEIVGRRTTGDENADMTSLLLMDFVAPSIGVAVAVVIGAVMARRI